MGPEQLAVIIGQIMKDTKVNQSTGRENHVTLFYHTIQTEKH